MNKNRIRAFRLLAVSMAAAMVLNSSAMTVLAKGLDGSNDDPEEITVFTENDGDEAADDEEADVIDEESDEGSGNEDSEDSDDSEEVDETDTSDDDVLNSYETLNLGADSTYTNSQLEYYFNINLNGYKLTVSDDFTTRGTIDTGENGELVVNGNMIANNNVKIRNGKLSVKGNYTQTNGYLESASGSVVINISKNIEFNNNGSYFFRSGKDKITVGGDFIYDTTLLSAYGNSEWIVKGNLTQTERAGSLKFENLVLDGTTEQTITFQKNSGAGNLTVKNSNVTLKGEYLNSATLQTDFAPKGNVTLKTDGMNLNGHKMTTPKGLEATGDINLKNSELVVNGDMITKGYVTCDNGKLTVRGNYTQTDNGLQAFNAATVISISKNIEFNNHGYHYLLSGKDKVTVGGNFVYSSDHSNDNKDSVWTVKGNYTQKDGAAYLKSGIVKLTAKGASVSLPNGKIDTLYLSYGKKNYTIKPGDCYDKLIATSILTFDANGGSTGTKNKKITTEQKYGELPVPTKTGSNFDGWYTKKTGGEKITANGIVTAVDDFTVYAHWKAANKPVTSITFDKTKVTLKVGEKTAFTATVLPKDATNKNINWSSSNKNIATVDSKGNVTAVAKGTVTITAKAADGSGKKATATVNVTESVTDIFDDVNPSDWFVNAVQYVYDNGIMSGVNGGKSFDPYGKLTREQFTQVLYAYEGKPAVTVTKEFSDVDTNAWYAKSVIWAKSKGIVGGKPDGTFGVGQNISRQDLALMLYKYAKYKKFDLTKKDNALDSFIDKGQVSDYAKDAMKWAVTQGVISGKGNGKVDPLGNATRAECAAMIMKLIEKNK